MEKIHRISLHELDDRNAERAKRFFAAYPPAAAVGVTDPPAPEYLGSKSPRRCRFCHGVRPAVKFSDNAHVLPQFMGNKNLRSYFECQDCNARFSRYEASFARFIGASRTISQIPGSGGKIPKHEDTANGLKLEMSAHALQLIYDTERTSFTVDLDKKELTFTTVRHPYVPIHLLKVLVKIGLSLLNEDELAEYETARRFILSDEHDALFAGNRMLHLYFYALPGPPWFSPPSAQLFTRAPDCPDMLPGKQIVLHYGNYCFQLAMPFGPADNARLLGKTVQLPRFPLLMPAALLRRFGEWQEEGGDFTLATRQAATPHTITCSFTEYVRVNPDEDEKAIAERYGG